MEYIHTWREVGTHSCRYALAMTAPDPAFCVRPAGSIDPANRGHHRWSYCEVTGSGHAGCRLSSAIPAVPG